jgi:hypothetical protein
MCVVYKNAEHPWVPRGHAWQQEQKTASLVFLEIEFCAFTCSECENDLIFPNEPNEISVILNLLPENQACTFFFLRQRHNYITGLEITL